ncbi:MAG: carboxypeptidase-like regulatory domain-containing protein [Acidobacteriota bacterium]
MNRHVAPLGVLWLLASIWLPALPLQAKDTDSGGDMNSVPQHDVPQHDAPQHDAHQYGVVVYADGWAEAMTDQPLGSDVDHVWIWSAHSAPRRVAPSQVDQEVSPSPARLTLDLPKTNPRQKRQASTLIAAPAEMWGEVPEALLPAYAVSQDGTFELPRDARPWRVRWIGQRGGSWWQDVPAGQQHLRVRGVPADDAGMVVLDANGHELADVAITVLGGPQGRGGVLAQYRSDSRGLLQLPKLPDEAPLNLIISHPGHVPTPLLSYPSGLPETLTLSPGFELAGRFVDAEGQPLAGVEVVADGWIARSDSSFGRQATSGADGTWAFAALPAGEIGLAARLAGFAPHATRLELHEATDLGDLELLPSVELPLRVLDDLGGPVASATVEHAGEPYASDRQGRVRLRHVPPGSSLRVSATAEGHLPAEQRFEPPHENELTLTLERAFRASGRFVDAEGLPVNAGSVRVTTGTRYTTHELSAGGRFELDLQPDQPIALELRSPSARELAVSVEPGEAGAWRDLGDLQAPPGLRVHGTLIRAEDGTPVAGGRIWAPGASEQGDLVAWAERNLIATTSGPDGRFTLDGLPPRPALLRVDAAGRARAHLRVDSEEAVSEVGEIVLSEGSRLEIFADPSSARADARVDLRGDWLELDMLTASLVDGRAMIPHVPPGPATVTVLSGRELLCEERIEVPESPDVVEVDCLAADSRVSGIVTVGGQPAAGGQLIWHATDSAQVHGLIVRRSTPLGARQNRTFGAGRPQVDVELDAAGEFWTEQLSPGSWQVSWLPPGGTLSPARRVEVPDQPHTELRLEFDGLAVTGTVLDADGEPVAEARVRDVAGTAFAFTQSDGSFSLLGLPPGSHEIYARHASATSSVIEVIAEQQQGPVTLTLEEQPEQHIEIRMVGVDGEAAAGAFVFLERSDNIHRMLTTGAKGSVTVSLRPPFPRWVRAAGVDQGSWQLGPWVELSEAQQDGLALANRDTGSVRIASETTQSWAGLMSADGWDLSRLMTRLGMRPTVSPDRPLEIQHLPTGNYFLAVDDFSTQIDIRRDDVTTLELP